MHGPYIYYVHSRFHSIWFSLDWFGWIELKSQNISLHLYRFGWVRRMKRTSCAIKREREKHFALNWYYTIKRIVHTHSYYLNDDYFAHGCTEAPVLPQHIQCTCVLIFYLHLSLHVTSRFYVSLMCVSFVYWLLKIMFNILLVFFTSVFHFCHMSARELVCKCMQLCTLREKEKESTYAGWVRKRSLTAQMVHCKMPSKKISSRASHTVEN